MPTINIVTTALVGMAAVLAAYVLLILVLLAVRPLRRAGVHAASGFAATSGESWDPGHGVWVPSSSSMASGSSGDGKSCPISMKLGAGPSIFRVTPRLPVPVRYAGATAVGESAMPGPEDSTRPAPLGDAMPGCRFVACRSRNPTEKDGTGG